MQALAQHLPRAAPLRVDELPDQYEEHLVEEVDIEAERAQFEQGAKEAYDEDEDRGGPRAGCRQA